MLTNTARLQPRTSVDGASPLLLVSSSRDLFSRLSVLLPGEGTTPDYELLRAASTPAAEAIIVSTGARLALFDLNMGEASMLRFLRLQRARNRAVGTFLIATPGQEESAALGLLEGALEVIFVSELAAAPLRRLLRLSELLLEARAESRSRKRRAEGGFRDSVAATFRLDLEGDLTECNESFARLLGYDSSDQLLRSDEDLLPSLRAGVETEENRDWLLELAGPVPHVKILERPDGSAVTVKMRCRVLRDSEDMPVGLEGSMLDLSWMESSLNPGSPLALRTHPLWRSVGEGLLVLNRQGRIEQLNEAASETLGYSEEELLGRTMMEPPLSARRANGEAWTPGSFPPATVISLDRRVRDVSCLISTAEGARLASLNAGPLEPRGTSTTDRVIVSIWLDSPGD